MPNKSRNNDEDSTFFSDWFGEEDEQRSQFFDNTKEEVENMMDLCGRINFYEANINKTEGLLHLRYRSMLQGIYNSLVGQIVDCNNLNSTEYDDSDDFFDQQQRTHIRKYCEDHNKTTKYKN